MAVSSGIFVQIFLVIFLCLKEVFQGHKFDRELLSGFFLFGVIYSLRLRELVFVGIIYSGTVLDPPAKYIVFITSSI